MGFNIASFAKLGSCSWTENADSLSFTDCGFKTRSSKSRHPMSVSSYFKTCQGAAASLLCRIVPRDQRYFNKLYYVHRHRSDEQSMACVHKQRRDGVFFLLFPFTAVVRFRQMQSILNRTSFRTKNTFQLTLGQHRAPLCLFTCLRLNQTYIFPWKYSMKYSKDLRIVKSNIRALFVPFACRQEKAPKEEESSRRAKQRRSWILQTKLIFSVLG